MHTNKKDRKWIETNLYPHMNEEERRLFEKLYPKITLVLGEPKVMEALKDWNLSRLRWELALHGRENVHLFLSYLEAVKKKLEIERKLAEIRLRRRLD